MYYLLNTIRNQTQQVRPFLKKSFAEIIFKILDKYSDKEFIKISF